MNNKYELLGGCFQDRLLKPSYQFTANVHQIIELQQFYSALKKLSSLGYSQGCVTTKGMENVDVSRFMLHHTVYRGTGLNRA